ncbi:MAG: hypothetical protein GX032_04185 [Tenericutes bacterium]|nr:hypothetical protein [Mycoplasmatota bacterium]
MENLKNKFILFGGFAVIMLVTIVGIYLLKVDNTKIIFKSPESYDELYTLLKEMEDNRVYAEDQNLGDLAPSVSKGESDYSETNIQVSGVDEADIIKTDGKYIYIIGNDNLYIVETNDGKTNIVSKLNAQEKIGDKQYHFQEMYLSNNKLIIIKGVSQYYDYGSMDIMPRYYWGGNQEVAIGVYDVTDKTNPFKINELSQSGSYISSRLINNYLYVTTNHYVYNDIVEDDFTTYVPQIKSEKTETIAVDDILILPNPDSKSYLTVTGMDINNSNKFISSKAVLGSSSNIYADLDNLYVSGYSSEKINNTYVSKTSLVKFSMNNGVLNIDATGSVNGNILNQFSMDEYNGNFRIVTTSNDYTILEKEEVISEDDTISSDIAPDINQTKNNLYVLDKDLKIIGKIEGLAKGERIYSVRFDKEIAYFVTFKQVDPLFVVDLSNPNNPNIKSELKIPGFSEYLHVYDEKYLFGLGREADKDGRTTGMKISMFDIQNKEDVKEKYKLVIGDQYSWSESSYNHKAILVSKDKNIIGFPINNDYVAYRFIDNVGFEKIGEIKFSYDEEYYFYGSVRGLYINDYLYASNQFKLISLNLSTLESGDTLDLDKKIINEDVKPEEETNPEEEVEGGENNISEPEEGITNQIEED